MSPETVAGLDYHSGAWHTVRVSEASGRPEILNLASSPVPPDRQLLDAARAVIAVPDRDITVKSLCVGPDDLPDLAARLNFELCFSLLEPVDRFRFEFVPAGNGRHLGLIYRRELLAQLSPWNGGDGSLNDVGIAHRARSLALGKAYLRFCRPASGELICLADSAEHELSLCFVADGLVAGLAHVKIDGPEDDRRLAIDLKTVVSFHLAALAGHGITVPLAALLISGRRSDDSLIDALGALFACRVAHPELNQAFFTHLEPPEGQSFLHYLVPLGLTVN